MGNDTTEQVILDCLIPGSSTKNLPRLAHVLYLRWGKEPRTTLAQIARELGLTSERIRQLEEQGLRMLRHRLRSKGPKLHALLPPHLVTAIYGQAQEDAAISETLTTTEVQEMVNGLAGRCKDCKWWEHAWTSEPSRAGNDMHHCEYLNGSNSDWQTEPQVEFAYDEQDSNGDYVLGSGLPYVGVIAYTAPDFGCVQFKPRRT